MGFYLNFTIGMGVKVGFGSGLDAFKLLRAVIANGYFNHQIYLDLSRYICMFYHTLVYSVYYSLLCSIIKSNCTPKDSLRSAIAFPYSVCVSHYYTVAWIKRNKPLHRQSNKYHSTTLKAS